jgi:glycosyltransferase involved in cell wall biosynthesis
MPGVIYLTDDLTPTGPGWLPAVLAPALRDRFRVAVGSLSPVKGPLVDPLAAADTPPAGLPVRHALDWNGLARVRKWVTAFGPHVLHAVGPKAARVAWLLTRPRVGVTPRPSVVVTAADRPGDGLAGWLTRRAIRSADGVTAATHAEAERYRRHGARPERVVVVPPGVPPAPASPDPVAFRRSLGVPDAGRLVLAAGRFDAADGLRSAVWAFDVVKYAAPDLYLVLIGDGPERDRLERFGKALGFDDYRVRFAGDRPDFPALAALAEVVWVTHERGGTAVALAGMAAGRPVVGVRTPDLAEVVEDGATGRLVAAGDRVQLAAVTNELLERPDLARSLGEAGRARAAAGFSAAGMVDRFVRLYDGLLAGSAATA